MGILYISTQGISIHVKSNRLVLKKEGRAIKEIPIFQIERIVIFGNVQLTTQAVGFLLNHKVPCSFLSFKGKFRGTLQPVESKNVFLRVTQYERYLDNAFRTSLAKKFVEAKAKNQVALIKSYSKNYPSKEFDNAVNNTIQLLKNLRSKQNVLSIMGIEGKISAIYFNVFRYMIRSSFSFESRKQHPPKDSVNALLSFAYTLLTNELYSLLCGIGFDPYIGYLHELLYGRPSLALDLIEEFRSSADKFVLRLINKRIIKIIDFMKKDDKAVYLTNEGRKTFFSEYENTLKEMELRKIMKEQIHKFSRTLLYGEVYMPYLINKV